MNGQPNKEAVRERLPWEPFRVSEVFVTKGFVQLIFGRRNQPNYPGMSESKWNSLKTGHVNFNLNH